MEYQRRYVTTRAPLCVGMQPCRYCFGSNSIADRFTTKKRPTCSSPVSLSPRYISLKVKGQRPRTPKCGNRFLAMTSPHTVQFTSSTKLSKVKWTCSCIAHRRQAPLMRYRFPYVGADLRKPVLNPGISEHCETTDTGWCITWYACLLSQLSSDTHSSLTTEGGLRLSRPGCLILRRSSLPVQRRSPT